VLLPQRGETLVLNLHLPLTHPSWRDQELNMILGSYDSSIPKIICGDFNILESPHITILNWLLGGSVSDVIFPTRERQQIEHTFAAYGLRNPLRGRSTHPVSYSQLDHVLISSPFFVQNVNVSQDRYGSDHAPTWIEVT
jgi:endonuclease/exonuclease/phosphatase family metal-dependent hydrolase